jgi:hypothetical protein
MLDMIVDRRELKAVIARALRFMGAGAAAGDGVRPIQGPEVAAAAPTTRA